MSRNRTRPQSRRPGVEPFEHRLLLSVADLSSVGDPVPMPAESNPAVVATPAATTAQDAIIGASEARARYGVTGAGLTAAVIDTGVNYNHPAFGGGGFGSGAVVVGGYDFGEGDADPMPSNTLHGTGVAGIIASRDPAALGVAPGAQIVALRVFDDSGAGSFDRIADALQWVVSNHETYNISVVNLSISDGKNYVAAPTLFASPVVQRIISLIDTLERLNIPVVTAAGNSFSGTQGMGFTAIVSDTISVTGSDGPDRIAADAQRLGRAVGGASATDLLAPGRAVVGPWDGSSFAPLDGTSFAAPLVTGSVLLLQELYLKRFGTLPTVDQIEGWLRDSADPVRDPVTGVTIGRLDIPSAAALIPSPSPSSPSSGTSGQGGGTGGSTASGSSTSPKPAAPALPSSPAAEPSDGSTGSGGSGSGAGSGSTQGGSRPSTPPSNRPAQGGSGSSTGDLPSSGSSAEPSPTDPNTPTPSPAPAPAPAPEPPSSEPAGPDAPSSPPLAAEPPAADPPSPGSPTDADAPAPPAGDVPPIDVSVVIDPGMGEDPEPAPAPAPADPVAPVLENDAALQLAALFRLPGKAAAVRAWNIGSGASVAQGRAQFLRASRLSTRLRPARPEGWRPFPAGSARPFAALVSRRSSL
ncbi:S8 family peptidase [Tautonia sociabilis]|uniref:Peptidase S8/S53 domain-containing protein n=1 Tax=Tautonia sociabilis TaxID=2080755 RepID=A0A432MNC9_9BACT|nr:S8 family serine peptidase [Tautonia sociabilis]RUL88605.1 hypothetical protein TsocGM_06695 [Tautonia sociabilis]